LVDSLFRFRPTLTRALPEPEQLTIGHVGENLPVTFLRSLRARRVSLRVDLVQRRIVLVAPLRISRATAIAFAQRKAGWIAARLGRLPSKQPFADGTELPFAGVLHRIRHRPDARGTVWLQGAEIHVAGKAEHLPRRLRDWLTAEARRRITLLAFAKAQRVGRTIKRVSLRDTRSRWGSCGSAGGLSFSWRLILAPPDVLDYLVAHETAHLVHMNHGPHFWALARELCEGPMEASQAWLKVHGERLLQYGA
jgi:predicted metal-dependent hydrolase